jgi:hypothetical protein
VSATAEGWVEADVVDQAVVAGLDEALLGAVEILLGGEDGEVEFLAFGRNKKRRLGVRVMSETGDRRLRRGGTQECARAYVWGLWLKRAPKVKEGPVP